MRQAGKLFAIFSLIAAFVLSSGSLRFLRRDVSRRRRARLGLTRAFCRLIARVLSLEVRVVGRMDGNGPRLLVANHLSYLDVFAILSAGPAAFVTSREVEKDPFLGTLCRLAGSAFVERRARGGIRNQIEGVAAMLADGLDVVVFPEGTSSDGSSVLPFKRGLFAAARAAGAAVLPLCINYREVNGTRLTREHRDCVFWYGSMAFFPHLLRVVGLDAIRVDVEILPPLSALPGERLAEVAHAAIARRFAAIA